VRLDRNLKLLRREARMDLGNLRESKRGGWEGILGKYSRWEGENEALRKKNHEKKDQKESDLHVRKQGNT